MAILWALVWILVLAIVLFIIWRIIAMFVGDPKIMQAIGLLFGLLLLIYAFYEFGAAAPFFLQHPDMR